MRDVLEVNVKELVPEDYKKVIDNSYDEIFVVDNKGIVLYVNEACERNYGLKPSEIIGKTVHYLEAQGYYHPVITPVVFREKKRVTFEQETIMGIRLAVTANPVLNEQGELELVVLNSRDISNIAGLKYDLEETMQLVKQYKTEVEELRKKELTREEVIARSVQMKGCLELAQKVASVDSTVLILGESGTGKNVMAKHIHKMSKRKEGPFININCAAIPDHLLESELFGYTGGAFTGADREGKMGLFELANGGTLFLDEISEIPLRLQAKLLGAIQESTFMPVGGRKEKKVDIRIIAATNRDLAQFVKKGEFREDLYYRLNVIELDIPPLRERKEDIIPLLHYFLDKFDHKYKVLHRFSPDVIDMLINYTWPGNVREVEHLVERLVVTTGEGKISLRDLPKNIYQKEKEEESISVSDDRGIKEVEKELIINAFKETGSSYKVANMLNISQSKANRLIRKYISKDEYDQIKKKLKDS